MGRLGGGEIRMSERDGGLSPVDEDSDHLVLHCWNGPVPIPPDFRSDFEAAAASRENVIVIVPPAESIWSFLLSLLGRGRRDSSGVAST